MRFNLDNVYLEVTRRCTLKCAHCMRGPAQNIVLSKDDVDMFFDKLNCNYIQGLTFGGGEPTLAPEIVVYIIDKIIERNIEVLSLGMITNGQRYSQEIADALNRFDIYEKQRREPGKSTEYCSSRVRIGFSVDKFHEGIKYGVREAYEDNCQNLLLYDVNVPDNRIAKTGYATIGYDYIYKPKDTWYGVEDDQTVFIYGQFNMTATGFVNTNGLGSYVDMDANNFGHISEFSIEDYLRNYGKHVFNTPSIESVLGPQMRRVQKEAEN